MSDSSGKILYCEDPCDVGRDVSSLGGFMIKKLKQHGDKVAFIDGKTSESITFSQVLEDSMKLALCLKKAGIKNNDVIGMVSENRMEFPIIALATYYVGATVAPMNVTYREHEIKHALKLAKPKILFFSPYVADRVMNVLEDHPDLVQTTVLLEEDFLNNPYGLTLFEEFLNDFNVPQNEYLQPEPVDIDEKISVILNSSGTTGLPKGVQLTQKNILSATCDVIANSPNVKLSKDEICLLMVIPWFHTFGYSSMFIGLSSGYKQVFLAKFEERSFLNSIQTHRVNTAALVPPLMLFLAKHPLVDNYDLSSMKEIICGAAPLGKEVQDAVKQRIGIECITQGYGMSETTYGVLIQTTGFMKHGSVGILSFGTSCKVVHTETGALLGPNESGELCFQGPLVMKGYINNEEETNKIIKDGWLHSGDIGYYDDNKEFFIVDRLKELIKYKGYQVPPAELEAILLTHPKINDVAVVGIPDDDAGEVAMAFVVKKPNVEIEEEEITSFVASQTSPAKRLHGGVRFIAEIPKSSSGKILRKDVKLLVKLKN